MNPLTLPVGVAVRVLGDLTAIATAARAMVPAAEGMAKVDFEQVQEDLHTLAGVARELPRVEGELTKRMDEAENTLERGLEEMRRATAAAESLASAAPEIQAGVPEIAKARKAAEKLASALPTLERAADAAEKLVGGLDEVRASREALLEARGQANDLIAAAERAQKSLDRASDNVEAALARAEPLQGLAERVGRLSERLPGGERRDPGA